MFQRDEAEAVASSVRGVISVDNEVDLVPPGPSAHDVQHSIKESDGAKREARRRQRDGGERERDRHAPRHGQLLGRSRRRTRRGVGGSLGVTRVKDHIEVLY
jgi:hypothetical protein